MVTWIGTGLAYRKSVILAVLRIKSAPHRAADLVQALRALMRSARAEKGFIACNLYIDADNANSICYEERWGTAKDLEEQLRSSRCTRLLTVMESAAEQPSLEFDFVSEVRGLEYVAAVRGEG